MPDLVLGAQGCSCGGAPVHLVAHSVHQIQLADALAEEAALGGALEVGRIVQDVVIPLVDHTVAVALIAGCHVCGFLVDD